MAIDIHKKGFDDGTLIKLYILRAYLKEWLPVFTKRKETYWDKIYLYDFFAGEGTDIDGNLGSPLIFLDEIKSHCLEIQKKKLKLEFIFNELSKPKFKKLEILCKSYLQSCREKGNTEYYCPLNADDTSCPFSYQLFNEEFKDCFSKLFPFISQNPKLPRFMFLDQYGIKQITTNIFSKLISLERTDFVFFISSSFALRFIELPEFNQYIKLTRQDFNENKPYHCHKVIFNYYKSLIPNNKEYYLAPFSIKKGKNIYGLIFGSNHTLGIEKFLNICWKINTQTGNANYDIDNEHIDSLSPKLFPEFNKPSKLQVFENGLKIKILSKELKSNKEIYAFTFEMGCLPSHANKVIDELKKKKSIPMNFKTTSQNVHKLEASYL
jgi:three-Cys-motif partner protein